MYPYRVTEVRPPRRMVGRRMVDVTPADVRDMTMQEFAEYRKQLGWTTQTQYNPFTYGALTWFDKWLEAREKFIAGTLTDIEKVVMYVREDETRYDEIALREENHGLHKHRFSWRRWPVWRWLVAWLHR